MHIVAGTHTPTERWNIVKTYKITEKAQPIWISAEQKYQMFPLKKMANIGGWIASRGIELPKESAWWSINRFAHAMNFGLALCTFFHSHLFALAAYFMHIILLRKLSSLRLALLPIVIVASRNAAVTRQVSNPKARPLPVRTKLIFGHFSAHSDPKCRKFWNANL